MLKQHGILVDVSAGLASRITATATAGTVKFKSTSAALAVGAQRELKLGLTSKAFAKLRNALRTHRSLKAHVAVSARDSSGKTLTTKRTVTLTR